jgi:hypothetical protein
MAKRSAAAYLNENGLVRGRIPPKTPCPFHKECGRKTDNCPSKQRTKENEFSCAAARLFSLIKADE